MTQLEQTFYQTTPTHLVGIEVELGKLNENMSRILELLENKRTSDMDVLKDSKPLCNHSIMDSDGAAKLLSSDLIGLDHEEVWILLLNSDMKPLRKERINIGNLSQTTIDTRRIVKSAIDNAATGIILYHNHPSGNPTPSVEDATMTEGLKKGLGIFSISLIDHIIISGNGKTYYSFAEEQFKSLKSK